MKRKQYLIPATPKLATKKDLAGKTFFIRKITHGDEIVGEIVYSSTSLIPENYLDISFNAVRIEGLVEYQNYLKELEETKLDGVWEIIRDELENLRSKRLNPDLNKLPMVIDMMKQPQIFSSLLDWTLPAKEAVDKFVRDFVRAKLLNYEEHRQVAED